MNTLTHSFLMQATRGNSVNRSNHSHIRKTFSEEEDFKLNQLVKKYGENEWDRISEMMEGRNARQVKDRWYNYLSPDLVKTPMSYAEDQYLIHYVNLIGRKWKMIANFFPGRTDIQLKSRFNVIMRKEIRDQKKELKKYLIDATKNTSSSSELSEGSITSDAEEHVPDNQEIENMFDEHVYDSFELDNEIFEFW